jgi:hypothetical protein
VALPAKRPSAHQCGTRILSGSPAIEAAEFQDPPYVPDAKEEVDQERHLFHVEMKYRIKHMEMKP